MPSKVVVVVVVFVVVVGVDCGSALTHSLMHSLTYSITQSFTPSQQVFLCENAFAEAEGCPAIKKKTFCFGLNSCHTKTIPSHVSVPTNTMLARARANNKNVSTGPCKQKNA